MGSLHLVTTRDTYPPMPRPAGLAGWIIETLRVFRAGAGQRRMIRKQMRLVETISLGGRKQLMLVSCGGERFLVGTGAESVQTIARVRPEPSSPILRPGSGFVERN